MIKQGHENNNSPEGNMLHLTRARKGYLSGNKTLSYTISYIPYEGHSFDFDC